MSCSVAAITAKINSTADFATTAAAHNFSMAGIAATACQMSSPPTDAKIGLLLLLLLAILLLKSATAAQICSTAAQMSCSTAAQMSCSAASLLLFLRLVLLLLLLLK